MDARLLTTQIAPRDRWLGLIAAYACVTAITAALGVSLPLIPLSFERAGYSGLVMGLNAAVGAAALLLVSPFIPKLAARIGAGRLLFIGLGVSAVCLAAFPHTPFWVWFPLRFFLNSCLQVLFVISEIWINTLAPEKSRGRLIGLYGALATAGFAAGPAVAGLFPVGSAMPFLLGAGVILTAIVPCWLARRTTPDVEDTPLKALGAIFFLAPAAVLAALAHALPETALTSLLPVSAVRIGWQQKDALLLITALGLGNVLLQIPIGWLSDRMDRYRVLLACALATGAGGLALPFAAPTPVLLFSVVFLWGGAVIGLYTVGLTLIGQLFKSQGLAAASTLFSMTYAIGSIMGPPAAGPLLDWGGMAALGGFVAAAAGLYAIVLVREMRLKPA